MKCPYCDKEMAKGKIPAGRDNICWYPEDVELGLFSGLDDNVILLAKVGFFEAAVAEAYYCADCKIVLTPVPDKQESTMDKLMQKWNDISEKRKAAAEERKIRQEEEWREREREKRGRKDPWER